MDRPYQALALPLLLRKGLLEMAARGGGVVLSQGGEAGRDGIFCACS